MTNFNKLWIGQTVSVAGSALTAFALPTLAVLTLHATPAQIGVLTAMQMLPFPILGIFIGVLADRASRRRIMIVADVARFAILASVPAIAFFGRLHLTQVYIVALASGVCSAFFGITYQSYLPVIVAKEQLTDANMKLEFSNSGAAIAGSALGGVLVQTVSAVGAIAVDALSYLVSVASLLQIRAAEPAHDGPPLSPGQALREIGEGFSTVLEHPNLRWITAATATTNFGLSMSGAVVFIYAYRILHLNPGLLGVVFGLAELGFAGAFLATRIRKRIGLRATLIGALFLSAISTACLLLAQFGFAYFVLFAAFGLGALCGPIYNVNQVTYRQSTIDVRLQGRVNATVRTFVWGTVPLGSIAGGYLADAAGIQATILISAIVAGSAVLWLLPVRDFAAAQTRNDP